MLMRPFTILGPWGGVSLHLRLILALDVRINLLGTFDPDEKAEEVLRFYERCPSIASFLTDHPIPEAWGPINANARWDKKVMALLPMDGRGVLLVTVTDPELFYWYATKARCRYTSYPHADINEFTSYRNRANALQTQKPLSGPPPFVLHAVELESLHRKLEMNIYQDIIEFFCLEDHYELASRIHDSWLRFQIRTTDEYISQATTLISGGA
jgi:hypothetical protein